MDLKAAHISKMWIIEDLIRNLQVVMCTDNLVFVIVEATRTKVLQNIIRVSQSVIIHQSKINTSPLIHQQNNMPILVIEIIQ